jgi:hypothetical protein
MIFFYVTANTNNNEPSCLQSISYVHVKACTDGSQTVVITFAPVSDPAMNELTQVSAQALLDSWIDAENQHPEVDVVTGEPMLQSHIDLSNFIDRDSTKQILVEQAHLHRIARSHATEEEKAFVASPASLVWSYPTLTRGMTQADLDVLLAQARRRMGT